MLTITRTLILGSFVVYAASQISEEICDERYDCEYAFTGADHKKYFWDLAPLCSERGYTVSTADNRTYSFNICGVSKLHCSPKSYESFLRTGPAVQFFGDTPPCNNDAPECTNVDTGKPECCTADCEVLGYGPPIFQLRDESNPTTGGLLIKHVVAPPSAGNPYQCVGANSNLISRQVTYVLTCDPNAPIFNPTATRAEEVSTCNYEIEMATRYACGCAPDCAGKTCGGDGCGGYCGGDGLGGECPLSQTCSADGICLSPSTPAAAGKGKYTKTAGDVAGALFGGMFLGVFLFIAAYFAYSKGYCAKAWSAVSGKGGGRGFSKMPAGASGSAASAPASSASYQGTSGYGSGAKA